MQIFFCSVGGHGCSSISTVNDTRRSTERAASEVLVRSGSSAPAPRTASRSGSTPRFFSSARTASARARLKRQVERALADVVGMPGQRDPRVDTCSSTTRTASALQLRRQLIERGVLSRRRQRLVVVEADAVRDWIASRSLPSAPSLTSCTAERSNRGRSGRQHPAGECAHARARATAADPCATMRSPSTASVTLGGGSSDACKRFRTISGSSA